MLEVNHINKSYGGKKALQGFNCVLEPDETYGLLDASGSGKTTLVELIINLILPGSGEILLNGTPISAAGRAHVAYMPTEPCFYPYMRIKDVGECYHGFFVDFSQETYRGVLDAFQLNPNLHIKNSSSDMMAKVKVTVTISRKADVILLDEPLNGIDLIVHDQVMDLIISRAGYESALLLSSHLVEEMERFISRVIFVKNDNMIASLDVEKLRIKERLSLAEKYRQLFA